MKRCIINCFKIPAYLLLLAGLFINIFEIYDKWANNPDILTQQKSVPTVDIPMPAITICSPLLARKKMVDLVELRDSSKAYLYQGKIKPV
jgi:hypothetical protein